MTCHRLWVMWFKTNQSIHWGPTGGWGPVWWDWTVNILKPGPHTGLTSLNRSAADWTNPKQTIKSHKNKEVKHVCSCQNTWSTSVSKIQLKDSSYNFTVPSAGQEPTWSWLVKVLLGLSFSSDVCDTSRLRSTFSARQYTGLHWYVSEQTQGFSA